MVRAIITDLAPEKNATCMFTRLEALKETLRPIENPSLSVNGKRFVFPTVIGPEGYLEYDGSGTAQVFSTNGFVTDRVRIGTKVPHLNSGWNRIEFASGGHERHNPPAYVTIITRGSPLN